MKFLFLFVLVLSSYAVLAKHYTDEEIDNMTETEYKNYLMNMSQDDEEDEPSLAQKESEHVVDKMESNLIDQQTALLADTIITKELVNSIVETTPHEEQHPTEAALLETKLVVDSQDVNKTMADGPVPLPNTQNWTVPRADQNTSLYA
jgi:hypothetical protein